MGADLIERSLDLVAERVGDPAPLVYARLFAEQPELEALFVRDRVGTVRGQMLQVALECLLDFAGPHAYSANFIRCERVNHEGLGVPRDAFDRFFATVIATFREALGDDWTPEIDAAWVHAVDGLIAAVAA